MVVTSVQRTVGQLQHPKPQQRLAALSLKIGLGREQQRASGVEVVELVVEVVATSSAAPHLRQLLPQRQARSQRLCRCRLLRLPLHPCPHLHLRLHLSRDPKTSASEALTLAATCSPLAPFSTRS